MFVKNVKLFVCEYQVDFYKRQVVCGNMTGQKNTVTGFDYRLYIC